MIENNSESNKKNFLERHPIVNAIISIVVLLSCCYFVIFIIKSFLTIIKETLSILSKLDVVIIVALITGTVTIATSVISKIIDYRKSKNEYLAQKREKPYEDFIDMFYKVSKNVNEKGSYSMEELNKDVFNINRQLTLWGSKEVVKKWVDFRAQSQLSENPPKGLIFIFEDIMNQMRKDMGTKKAEKGYLIGFVINDIKGIKQIIRNTNAGINK